MSAPDPLTREQARDLAERELSKPVYQRDQPSFLEKMIDQLREWLDNLMPDPPRPTPQGSGAGSSITTVLLLVLLAALVLVIGYLWMRNRRNPSGRKAVLDDVPSRSVDHRAAAEKAAAAGGYAEAIRERLRAIARDLEERAILEPRPGRTAFELALEASAALPVDLLPGARIFDDVWYGDRPGTAESYAVLVALDDAVRAARPRPLETV
ncbi:DUF4129 domain-containing protein [Actinocorallia sp. API 0066]|uniref:DUF4129 domain-containing protein n=1 Tax=Actinocorallia sp. API 0066 TaxID=2896846 RepID=UPI001E41BE18|nr:DUF4129 domain-containing protein [Actinocorallia sp. API 0066]MCD0451216.1 DUF4129 domain-containing protein [Actinocorallia sp. API 0066]